MPSVFKHISDEDLKLDKSQVESYTAITPFKPKLTGIKIAICFSFILALVSLVGASLLYEALNSERRAREGLIASQEQFETKAQAMETTLNQYQKEVDRMREQLKAYGSQRNELRVELEESRSEIGALQTKMAELEKRNKMIDQQAMALQPVSVAVPAVVAAPVIPPVVEQVVITPPVPVVEAPVAEAPVLVETAKPQPPIEPQVLSVNRKFNFVVVNLGLRDGLQIGERLSILRDGKKIGRVQVEKLYEKFSAATITKEPKNAPLAEGDAVQPE